MRWLEDALKMRRVALSQGQLRGELLELGTPCECSFFACYFEQTIEAPRNRAIQ
jgi:hypothetical protein